MTVRVLVCDDQALVRAGFTKLLDATDGMEVVAEAQDGQSAVEAVRRVRPDVVLMDLRMPGMDGVAATSRIRELFPATQVLVVTTFGADDYVADALRAGASGFLLKDAYPEALRAAIRAVARGECFLDPAVTRGVVEAAIQRGGGGRATRDVLGRLTERERVTLELIARGLTNAEVAERLVVSEATVKSHIGHLFTKLGARDRVQAVIFAYQSGIAGAE
jgi:DNA-binding NarL/FixJ family response regulator